MDNHRHLDTPTVDSMLESMANEWKADIASTISDWTKQVVSAIDMPESNKDQFEWFLACSHHNINHAKLAEALLRDIQEHYVRERIYIVFHIWGYGDIHKYIKVRADIISVPADVTDP